MAHFSCEGCKPPKRTRTCHFDGTCLDYIIDKAFHDAELAAKSEKNQVQYGLNSQTAKCVHAIRKYKRKVRKMAWRRIG